ncbi:MAG: hypothetical protein U0Z75_04495 [Deinococcaceae bacterium]
MKTTVGQDKKCNLDSEASKRFDLTETHLGLNGIQSVLQSHFGLTVFQKAP